MKSRSVQAFADCKNAAEFLSVWLNSRLLSDRSQDYVDTYYCNFRRMTSPRIRHWYNHQIADAEAIVLSQPGLRVLEIGVGSGTEFLWWAMLGADVTGIDPFKHCTDVASERLSVLEQSLSRQLRARVHMIQLIDFNDAEGFDLIWMEQAFHHLEPRAEVLKKISQLLRPGGRVVLSEANALNPLLQLQLLRARGLKMFYNVQTDRGTVIYGNERVLSRRKLAKLLKSVQIEMEDSHYYRLFPSHPFFDSLFALEQKVSSPLFAPAFSHYNFVGRKVAARHT